MTGKFEKTLYQREWIKKRRQVFFVDKCCAKCGSTEKLELDHIDPATKTSNSIWSWREERRLEELAKCQVLCHSCHLQKTKIDMENMRMPQKHGTNHSYEYHGCRCPVCKSASAKRKQLWRKKTGKH